MFGFEINRKRVVFVVLTINAVFKKSNYVLWCGVKQGGKEMMALLLMM
jgi:hypothetical protein